MSATTETTHSPWCPEGPHVEDDAIRFYMAVEELYRQRTGAGPRVPSVTAIRAAATLLAAFDEAEEGIE